MSNKNKLKAELILEVVQLQERVKELESGTGESIWHDIVESSPDHILTLDTDLEIQYVNRPSPGLTTEELVGSPIIKFVVKEKQAEIKSLLTGVIKTKKPALYETEYPTPDGGMIYFETHAIPRTSAGKVVGLTLCSRDITASKLVEKEIEDFFNLFPDMVGVFSTDGKLIKINPSWEKVLGYTQKELLDLGWAGLVHPEDVEPTNKVVEKQLEGSSVELFVNRYKCKDGSYKTLEWQATYAKEGIVFATARDITERKQEEEELKKALYDANQFSEIVDNLPSYIYIKNKKHQYQYANQMTLSLFNRSKETIQGCDDTEFFPQESIKQLWEIDNQVFENGVITKNEINVKNDDNTITTYWEIKYPLYNENSELYALCGISTDITERIKNEEKLQESERQLKEAQTIGGIGRWEYDIDSQKVTWSDQVFKLFERDPSLGEPTIEEEATYYHPEDSARLHEYSRLSIAERKSFEYDVEVLLPGGKSSYMTAVMSPITDKSGRVVKQVGTIQDITKRKLAEESLRASEEYLRQAGQIAHLGYWSRDIKTGEIIWSDESYRIFGLEPQAVKVDIASMTDYIHPEDRQMVIQAIQDSIAGIQPYDLDYRALRPDGEVRWVHSKGEVNFDENNQPRYVFGTVLDITERVLMEKALQENEEKYHHLFNNAEVGIFRTRIDGSEILDMNDRFLDIFKRTRAEMESSASVIYWEDSREREEVIRHLQAKGRVRDFECGMLTKNGEVRRCLTSMVLYPTQGILEGSIIDITDRHQAEQERKQLLLQLQQANERYVVLSRELINSQEAERKRISRELHDDLGQVLTGISLDLGKIELDLDTETPQEIKKQLFEMRASVEGLDERISELALDLRPSLLDDLGLIPTIEWYVTRFSRRVGVEIDIDTIGLEKRLPPEVETALYRIIQEALNNVAKHAQASKVYLQLEGLPAALTVTIEDDGLGYDQEDLQTTLVSRQGIGLTGIKERVSLLGGRLEILSKPGEGTRIEIEIPL